MTQLAILFVLTSLIFSYATADSSKDTEECAPQLAGLATCLPYVGGQAKAPTPDCCNGLKQVLKNDKKCLCVIIKDRNDPNLGLNINASLAMGLPSVCHATANVSKCPELLHLDPKSPEAKIFYQFGKDSGHGGISPASAPVPGGAVSTGVAENPASAKNVGTGSSAQMKSNSCSGNRSMWLEFVTVGILLCYINSLIMSI